MQLAVECSKYQSVVGYYVSKKIKRENSIKMKSEWVVIAYQSTKSERCVSVSKERINIAPAKKIYSQVSQSGILMPDAALATNTHTRTIVVRDLM
jgi:hypothetical protein